MKDQNAALYAVLSVVFLFLLVAYVINLGWSGSKAMMQIMTILEKKNTWVTAQEIVENGSTPLQHYNVKSFLDELVTKGLIEREYKEEEEGQYRGIPNRYQLTLRGREYLAQKRAKRKSKK